MGIDEVLFLLRLISAVALLALMAGFFVVVWREYGLILHKTSQQMRILGRLHILKRLENMFVETNEGHPLYPITTIGRAPTNSIVLNNHFASSDHASISLKDGQWWLEDRGSRNGTLLNDEKITIPTIVTDGDIISIGDDHFKLLFTGKD